MGGCGGGVVWSGWVHDVMVSGWGSIVHLIGRVIFFLKKDNIGDIGGLCDGPYHRGHWGVSDGPMMPPWYFLTIW